MADREAPVRAINSNDYSPKRVDPVGNLGPPFLPASDPNKRDQKRSDEEPSIKTGLCHSFLTGVEIEIRSSAWARSIP